MTIELKSVPYNSETLVTRLWEQITRVGGRIGEQHGEIFNNALECYSLSRNALDKLLALRNHQKSKEPTHRINRPMLYFAVHIELTSNWFEIFGVGNYFWKSPTTGHDYVQSSQKFVKCGSILNIPMSCPNSPSKTCSMGSLYLKVLTALNTNLRETEFAF